MAAPTRHGRVVPRGRFHTWRAERHPPLLPSSCDSACDSAARRVLSRARPRRDLLLDSRVPRRVCITSERSPMPGWVGGWGRFPHPLPERANALATPPRRRALSSRARPYRDLLLDSRAPRRARRSGDRGGVTGARLPSPGAESGFPPATSSPSGLMMMNCTKNSPTLRLWQAPASTQKTQKENQAGHSPERALEGQEASPSGFRPGAHQSETPNNPALLSYSCEPPQHTTRKFALGVTFPPTKAG